MKKATTTYVCRSLGFVGVLFPLPTSVFAMSTDYSQYTPGQTMNVVCDSANDPFDVF